MPNRPFNPTGPTVLVAGATSAPSGVQVPSVGAGPAQQYRIHNGGAVTAFVAFGISAAAAQADAVIPTGSGANSKNAIPVPAGAIEILSLSPNCFVSAITGSSTASVYVTPGEGL